MWQVEKWQRRVVGDDGKVRWQKCDVELKIRRQKVTAFDIYYTIMQIYIIYQSRISLRRSVSKKSLVMVPSGYFTATELSETQIPD